MADEFNYGALINGALQKSNIPGLYQIELPDKPGENRLFNTLNPQQAIDWITSEFYIPELQGPIVLEPYQKAVLREALRMTAEGHSVYKLVVWSDLKKSAKTTIAAAVMLYLAMNTRYGTYRVVANDQKQADSRLFSAIVKAIDLNPRLKRRCHVVEYKHLIKIDNQSVIEAIPTDPSGEAGAGDDLTEYTELHSFQSAAALKLWTETTLSPLKPWSRRWTDTYAGQSGKSPILEPIYTKLVKPENRIVLDDPDYPADLPLYAVEGILCMWNHTPRCSWQTPSYYQTERNTLTPSEYSRVHENLWVSSSHVFVSEAWWLACQQSLPPLDKYKEVVVSLDAGVSSDNFAIVVVSRTADKVIVREVYLFKPPENGKLNFDEAEKTLRDIIRRYNVICCSYDNHQLHHFCTRLSTENVAYFQEFSQGDMRLIADKQLFDVIRDRRIIHDGNADLTDHIKNADAIDSGEKLRIVKRNDDSKIDAAVGLSMAVYTAYKMLPE